MTTATALDVVCGRIEARAGGHPTRVAVDGITAAGETTFADGLATALREHGTSVVRVSMDGFHNPRAVRYRQAGARPTGTTRTRTTSRPSAGCSSTRSVTAETGATGPR